MNILITSQKAELAGSTYSVSYLAEGLTERGHQVWVASPRGTLLWDLLTDTQVNLIHAPFTLKLHWPSVRQVSEIVQQHQIDVINAQASRDRYSTILARWWFKLPVRLIHTRRQMVKSLGMFGQSSFYEKGTDAIVAVSGGVKKSLHSIGISENHIKVIYNGTPEKKYANLQPKITDALRKKYKINPGDSVIGCVARYKRQVQLLKALQYIDQPVHIVFVGIDETSVLKAVREQNNLPHQIHYAGSVSNELVLHHFPLFTLNVLPSTMEGLSQSLLESMALGVPVIATNMGGNAELIQHGTNGFLFENGNYQQLAKHINLLLSDAEKRNKFSQAGQKTALQDFSLKSMLDQYEAFFEKLIHSKASF